MPKHYEFVFAAYSIWILVFGVYLLLLHRRERMAKRALERLSAGPRNDVPGAG